MKKEPTIQIDRTECWPNRLYETNHGETKGCVATHYGFVKINQSSGILGGQILLEFIHNGFEYSKWIYKIYKQRYIVTLARRFANDVMNGKIKK